MKRVIDTSEILGTVDFKGGDWEICASAEAGYDSENQKLNVNLDAFLRFPGVTAKDIKERPEWLPHPESISEPVSLGEASEVARDIFHSWVRKIREAAPSIHSPTF
jgi:hypothetical protein